MSTTPVANLPPISRPPAANFATSSACVVDTGCKFANGVYDTGGQVSTTQVANNGNNIRLQTP